MELWHIVSSSCARTHANFNSRNIPDLGTCLPFKDITTGFLVVRPTVYIITSSGSSYKLRDYCLTAGSMAARLDD